jgi:hypothetical protein
MTPEEYERRPEVKAALKLVRENRDLLGRTASWMTFKHRLIKLLGIPESQSMAWDVPIEFIYAQKRTAPRGERGWSKKDAFQQVVGTAIKAGLFKLDGAAEVPADWREGVKKQETVYVRIGKWRQDETSFNYAAGGVEAGVSVFEAIPEGDRFKVLLDDEHDPDSRQLDTLLGWAQRISSQAHRMVEQTPIFIVSGDYVGIGYDGEPLLRGLKVVREIGLGDLLAPEIGLK